MLLSWAFLWPENSAHRSWSLLLKLKYILASVKWSWGTFRFERFDLIWGLNPRRWLENSSWIVLLPVRSEQRQGHSIPSHPFVTEGSSGDENGSWVPRWRQIPALLFTSLEGDLAFSLRMVCRDQKGFSLFCIWKRGVYNWRVATGHVWHQESLWSYVKIIICIVKVTPGQP